MKKFFVLFATLQICYFAFMFKTFADDSVSADTFLWDSKNVKWIDISSSADNAKDGFVGVLIYIQNFLLTVVLPVVAIGSMIYIAYELLTAEGDESKLKKAWKSVVYSIVAIIVIMLSALVVRVIASLNLS